MANTLQGLAHIKFGDPDTALTNPVTMKEFVEDSINFVIEKPEKTEVPIEDSDDPLLIISKQGLKTLTFGTYDMDADTMIAAFGGTKVSGTEVTVGPATTIAFNDNGASADTIGDTGNGFGSIVAGDIIKVTGSTSNDGNYRVATAAAGLLTLEAGEKLSDEVAGASITIKTGGEGWSAPSTVVITEKSIEVKSKAVGGQAYVLTIQRANITADFSGVFNKTGAASINFECEVLKPASGASVTLIPVAA